jgi:mannose-6-phosphate isomerase-like protein (cupin superfamily)
MKNSKILLCTTVLFCLVFQACAVSESPTNTSSNNTGSNISMGSNGGNIMDGYVINIEKKSLENNYFREVLFTGPHSQLVVMSIAPGEDIGMETHKDIDQFIRVEAGIGLAILNGKEYNLENGSAVVVPAGTAHNIVNRSKSEPLKLYTIYSPPNHPQGTINKDKAAAIAYEKERQK